MKNAVIIIVLLILAGAGAYTAVRRSELKNQALEIEARKAEDERKAVEADRKAAEAEARKAEADTAAERERAKANEAERRTQELALKREKEQTEARAEETRKAELDAQTATENAKRAERERKKAEEERKTAELLAKYAMETNAARQAELQIKLEDARLLELEIKKKIATSNVLALQKADYATKLAEVEKLQEELRRREEETRPNKTLQQLMEQNEAAREAELAEMAKKDAQYAEEEAARRRILREGVPAAPKKPLSATDKRLAAALEALDNVGTAGRTVAERRIVARLEPLIREAAKDGRMEDAEAYFAALKFLVPDYGK